MVFVLFDAVDRVFVVEKRDGRKDLLSKAWQWDFSGVHPLVMKARTIQFK